MPLAHSSFLRRLLREPLLHFVIAGALVFAMDAWLHPNPGQQRQIVVSQADLARLRQQAQAQWGHPPDATQLQGLVQALVHEEVLVREALALGLDRDDDVVRRRLAQKMEFLGQQDVQSPDDAALQAWFSAHASRYQQAETLRFEHRYFGGKDARQRAQAALAQLKAGVPVAGDRFLLSAETAPQDRSSMARDYGQGFADAVFTLPTAQWSEPLQSSHGWHLVRVTVHTAAQPARLEQVYNRVAADVLNDRIAKARDASYAQWLSRYQVTLPDGFSLSPSASALPQP